MDIAGKVKMQKTVFFWVAGIWGLQTMGIEGKPSEIQAVEAAQEELSTCRALFEENQESIKCVLVCCIHPTYPNILKGTNLFFEAAYPIVMHDEWNLHYGIVGYAMAPGFLNLEDLHAGGDGTSLQVKPPEG